MTFILHPYTPEARPKDQIETQEFLAKWRKDYSQYPVIDREVHTFEYELLINELWRKREDFIIVEHDIVPTQEQLLEIINCPEPLCAAWYWCYPASTKAKEPMPSIRNIKRVEYVSDYPNVLEWRPIDSENLPKTCDVYPLGLTKFTAEVMQKVAVKDFFDDKNTNPEYWRVYDTRLGIATYHAGFKCHIHKEVKHNHRGAEPEPKMAFGTPQVY